MHAIYVFTPVARKVPRNSGLPATVAECTLYENCPGEWTPERCRERAAHLEARFGHVFVVRSRLPEGGWTPVPQADYARGAASARRAAEGAQRPADGAEGAQGEMDAPGA
jgi:hypothetical protein